MKRRIFTLLIVLLGLSACTTFHGVTVISPKAGHPNNPTKVESLQPNLKWQPSSETSATYDVIIYEGIGVLQVYYREGLKGTEHKVEEPLKPDKQYYWSVRVRQGEHVSDWSSYDYILDIGIAYVKGYNLLFMFRTPKR